MKNKIFVLTMILIVFLSGMNGCIEEEKKNNDTKVKDTDKDGLSDEREIYLGTNISNQDSDGDGIYDFYETHNETPIDTNQDGIIDALDSDDDGDSIPTTEEEADPNGDGKPDDALDTDNDDIFFFFFIDDDNDGILTINEVLYSKNINDDVDEDGIFNFLDTDSDNDSKLDWEEGTGDIDGDGIPNFLDSNDNNGPNGDLDGDNATNQEEHYNDPNPPDSNDDGTPDYLDPDTNENEDKSKIENSKFIGSWYNTENSEEHWIFYNNYSIKKSVIEIDDFTNEPYMSILWSIYTLNNSEICIGDIGVEDIQPAVCYDFKFSNNDTTLIISFDEISLIILNKNR